MILATNKCKIHIYIESPVALGGIQLTLKSDNGVECSALEGLAGMERTEASLEEGKLLMLAYSMSRQSISAGKHALALVGDATVETIIASDVFGRNVMTINGSVTRIEQLPYGFDNFEGAEVRYFDMVGRQVSSSVAQQSGIYIMRMYIDGKCVKTYKKFNR